MSLPVIDRPVYKTTILSRKDPVLFTPYTTKEQKLLLMARESKEIDSIVDSLRQILKNCLVDKTIDVDQLPIVDLEWLFLHIQARSAGEKNQVYYKCTNEKDGKTCGMLIELEIDLLNVPIINKNFNKRIMINDKIGLEMKLPSFEATQRLIKTTTNHDMVLAAACIDYIFDEQAVYKSEDATDEELLSFIEQLPIDKYNLIEKFFENCPVIRQEIEADCPRCSFHHKITLEGLEDFF